MSSNIKILYRGGTYNNETDQVEPEDLKLASMSWVGLSDTGQSTIDFNIGEVFFEDFTFEQVRAIRKMLKDALKEADEK